MAITISSLTPENPATPVGGTITFTVSATTDSGNPLTYEWQYSTDNGVSYTSSGLTGNTSASYTTSILTAAEDGLYWRVVISDTVDTVNSDEVAGIGDRILSVTAAATISLLSEPGETGYTLGAGADLELTWTTTLLNSDITTPVTTLNATIQKSSDGGTTWTDIGDKTTGTTPISETDGITYVIDYDTSYVITSSPLSYGHEVKLTINDITFAINNYQYRLTITDSTASNTPVVTSAVTVLINPEITIIVQPGVALTDSDTASCYKTGISNTGDYRVSISALTTAGVGLGYDWQYSYLQSDGTYTDFVGIQEAINLYHCKLKTGTSSNSSILELERLIYFEEWRMRCVLTGTSGEVEVTSDTYSIFMTDSVVKPDDMTDVDALEDYYGDIPDRSFYTAYAIETASFESTLDISRNTGLNGNLTMVIESSNDNGSTWSEITETSQTVSQNYGQYYLNPSTDEPTSELDISYTTPPLRIADNDGDLYRTKVTSSAVYTLSGNTKTLTPIYSDNNATLNVYRQIFITGQPTTTSVFPNFDASFAVTATPSSTATLTYQWQRSDNGTTWTNITAANAGSKYTGYTTNLLTLSDVTSSDDSFYRVIINAPDTLSSVTSETAELILTDDFFTVLSNLNDYYVLQFANVSWTVDAQSISLGTVSYQWQKSTNFNSSNPSAATWTNISGQTTNTYSINSVGTSDNGYYRCQVTSEGGTIDTTNAVELEVTAIGITILTNLPSSFTVLEGAAQEVTYEVDAIASIGDAPTYQWQYSDDSGTTWNNYGTGYLGQTADNKVFIPNPIDKANDNRQVRCKIDATSVPSSTYSNVATLNVIRRFTYFADAATKGVVAGDTFLLDLNPTFTGGSPSYQWYKGSTAISGATGSSYSFTAAAGDNGSVYKCAVTLADVDQHQYSRNNVDYIVSKSSGDFTETVTLSIVTAVAGIGGASSYTTETIKSGAAIGTVICIPKPGDYVHSATQASNDNAQWKQSTTGSVFNTSASSTETSGSNYNANKPSWVTDPNYVSPRWKWSDDRFPGYIELRGQWVKKADFPALYRVIGDAYGVTSDAFRLPMPIGKKLMGTGNVDNTSGSTSIEPLYAADGTSGGDKNIPGTIGGVWNYIKSKQLPPGSPGVGVDGTAGSPDPSTFTLGNFSTSGFESVEATADTTFSGKYKFKVGPLLPWAFNGVPDHSHSGISAGFAEDFVADKGGCNGQGVRSPNFYEVEPEGGTIISGPEGIAEADRGRVHSHAVDVNTIVPGNNYTETHSDGIGPSKGAGASTTITTNLEYKAGSSNPSFNMFLEPAPITMTTATKSIFDGSLAFVLKNNEELPLLAPYFRLKYLIKAY